MDSSGAPAPGWFTDPGDPSTERWWSGEAWTDYTRVPDAVVAPVAPAAPVHAKAYGAGQAQTPAHASAAPVGTLLEERVAPQEPAFPVPAAFADPVEPAAPAFPVPAAFADPVTPAPAAAASEGFVMPDLSAEPLIAPLAPEPYAAPAPTVPAASAPPVPFVPAAPSSLPSTADPDIAQHYRQALNTPEPVSASFAPPLAGSPTQEGWGGMPLPQSGGSGAVGYDPSGGYRAPDDARSVSSYAAARTAANTTIPSLDNKVAKVALSTGLSSLGALALIFFGRIVIVPSLLSLVAIVTGIVGLALVKRAGSGLWPALGGLLMGLATAIAVGVSIIFAMFDAASVDTAALEAQIVEQSAMYYGIDVVSANCPSDISVLTTTTFSCTAIDSSGVAYLVDVEIIDTGEVLWDLRV